MINFRYHVVSLTAVFLALAIGLVVGTAALNGPLTDALNDQVSGIRKQNEQYRDQVNHLKDEANRQEQFAREAAPVMLAGRLTGRKVLVVALPSGGQYVDGVVENLTLAGAKVTGRLELQGKFVDPANSDELLDLALLRPPSIGELPTNSNGVETSTALLAAVLVERSSPLSADARRQTLSSFTTSGYVVVTGDVAGPADSVVLVTGAPYVDREAPKKNAGLLTVAEQFDKVAPLVVAGDGVGGDGNVVKGLRADPTLGKTISTVDNVSTPQGRVVTVLALLEQLGGHAGHYGVADGSASLVPKPAAEKKASGS